MSERINWIKAKTTSNGKMVFVRQVEPGGRIFLDNEGNTYIVKDLDFTVYEAKTTPYDMQKAASDYACEDDDATVHHIRFNAHIAGARWAFRQIEREIDFCAVEKYAFPILHIRDFIDKMLGRKQVG